MVVEWERYKLKRSGFTPARVQEVTSVFCAHELAAPDAAVPPMRRGRASVHRAPLAVLPPAAPRSNGMWAESASGDSRYPSGMGPPGLRR